ncbi:MAG TPA: hypothetical protein VGG57_21270 [Stellaceae bacterium]|jgi:hypothetical protein
MRRRDLLAILGGATLARPARAAAGLPRLGAIMSTDASDPVHARGVFALQQGLPPSLPIGRREDFW